MIIKIADKLNTLFSNQLCNYGEMRTPSHSNETLYISQINPAIEQMTNKT